MPVSNMYNEPGNLQIHHNASPRPPSSDADSGNKSRLYIIKSLSKKKEDT